ncbi:hypothetical protein BROUX41_001469 [Berkeleyomyces rouxiae]|uniref:uncharacterized protein n=1 Tax=Berkeleyomyces rouxiae TaxID=2035830 RepID=UPI003B8126E9
MSGPAPPILPPKLGSTGPSRHGTPSAAPEHVLREHSRVSNDATGGIELAHPVSEMDGSSIGGVADPGPKWVPAILEDKSTRDLSDILRDPKLLQALTDAPTTTAPSVAAPQAALHGLLLENIQTAQHLVRLEERLTHERAVANAQLLAAKKLERDWGEKQREVDAALARFMPAALYQRLGQGVAEQQAVCEALEESFVDGLGGAGEAGEASERETMEWIKRYKEAKMVYWRRKEQKERWDEGRVGGWR